MAKATPFRMTTADICQNGYGLLFCLDNYTTTLAADTEQHVTVPGSASEGTYTATTYNKFLAVFSYAPSATVFVANNATAVIATGSFVQSASQLNPPARQVKAGDVLSFITHDTTAIVQVSFYAIP